MSEETPAAEPPAQQQEEAPPPAVSGTEGGSDPPPPTQTQDEEVKSKPTATPAPAPAPEFNVVKQGFIQRQGHLWKSWYRQWMTLDEGGVAVRWYKTEQRTGNDGTLYMSKCAEVCEPQEGLTTNWPPGMEGRCFVVCSPNRAHYIIAESEEDKKEWIQKLTEAKNMYNTTGVGIISVDLLSVEAIKVTLSAEMERAQGETDRALAAQGTSTEQVGKDLDKAVQDVEKEVNKETTQQEAQQEVQVETEVKIEAGGGAPEVVMEVKTETKKEEVKVEVQVETGGDAVAEVVVTTEETTTEVEVTAAAAEEEEKEEQPPATEDAAKDD